MIEFFLIFFGAASLALVACFVMSARNDQVYFVRVWFLNEDEATYNKLPKYDEMLYSWKYIRLWSLASWKKYMKGQA